MRSHVNTTTSTAAETIQAARLTKLRFSTSTGVSNATVPIISPILQIQEPMALPRAIPVSPTPLAIADTTSSGVVVARLTSVPPMTNRGTRNARPMAMLESTNRSPPLATRPSPMTMRTTSYSTATPVSNEGAVYRTSGWNGRDAAVDQGPA